WLQTVSHKGLRLLLPLFHVGALTANLLLAPEAPYRVILLAQVLFYGAAAAGIRWRSRLLSVPYTLCVLNCAPIPGFFRFVSGRQRATWERASRPGREGP